VNSYLNSFFRSVIESLTEFLPVSSTGHLFLWSYFFPFQGEAASAEFDDLFDIFIQSGAILAVVVLYFSFLKEKFLGLVRFLKGSKEDRESYLFFLMIFLGTAPVLLAGFIFKKKLDVIKQSSYLLLILACTWILGGIAFLILESYFKGKPESETKEISIPQAVYIGLFQCIALIPGVSRSAMTILSGRYFGLSKGKATEYSFFLALPVLIIASGYKLMKHRHALNSENIPVLGLGFFLTFVFSIVIIKAFLEYVRKYDFKPFGWYRIVLGASAAAYFFMKN